LFGLSSEKIPFFRSLSEEDPNMIRRNGFSNRSKPVKSSQNRSSFSQVPEMGKFCNTFALLTQKMHIMLRVTKEILGGFSGKVGAIAGANCRG
jgi:hypothetical protein